MPHWLSNSITPKSLLNINKMSLHIQELLKQLEIVNEKQEFKRLCSELQPLLQEAKNLTLTLEYRKLVNDFRIRQNEMQLRNRKDLFSGVKLGRGSLKEELKETVGMLDLEIEKSRANYGELDTSSKTMERTTSLLGSIGGALDSARLTLKSLVAKDEKDKWILYTGLGIFFATCCYIAYKRI